MKGAIASLLISIPKNADLVTASDQGKIADTCIDLWFNPPLKGIETTSFCVTKADRAHTKTCC